jgi:hypothetical protein
MNQFITRDFYRAMGVHANRMTFAMLYVNDVYFGFYALAEEFDSVWVGDTWNKHRGNFYKVCCDQWLSQPNKSVHGIKIRVGQDPNMTQWSTFYTALNTPNITANEFAKLVNVDLYTRSSVTEVFVVSGDGSILNGNNYGFYHHPDHKWMDMVTYDYESTLQSSVNHGVLESYIDPGRPVPILFKLILSFPQYRQTYIKLFQTFLTRVFSSAGVAELQRRITVLGAAVVQQVARDANYNLQGNRTPAVAQTWIDAMHSWVVKRAQVCAVKLNVSISLI